MLYRTFRPWRLFKKQTRLCFQAYQRAFVDIISRIIKKKKKEKKKEKEKKEKKKRDRQIDR